ncbi:MAG: hypothetical protein K2L89_02990 [Muribaculaceae bacterium]|nr:hypothetical protein [Muribaculaceae bacterium]
MAIFLIISSCVLWLFSLWLLRGRQMLAPEASFLALLILSVAKKNGWQLLPINMTMLTGWLCMTLVVMFACYLQPAAVRAQTKGWGYMTGGGIVGMMLGLLGSSFNVGVSVLYGIMILATVIGIFLGFLLYTNTPDGRPVAPRTGYFFKYLLAKGFPTAITIMQAGVALVLLIVTSKA